MGFFKRLFGICETDPPSDQGSWMFREGRITIDLSRAPELKDKGGAIALEGLRLPGRVLVVHGEDGEYHAFTNRCTHKGRRIDPVPGQPALRCCSVGKATYDYQGRVQSGPAKGPLTRLTVESKDGKLVISSSS